MIKYMTKSKSTGVSGALPKRAVILLLGAVIATTSVVPASAFIVPAPTTAAHENDTAAPINEVQYRGGHYGFGHRGHGPSYGYRGRHGGGYGGGYRHGSGYGYGVGAGIVGLGAGALIGSAIASQAQAAPGGDAVAYCADRFKSYDPESGSYLGYDGLRHACP